MKKSHSEIIRIAMRIEHEIIRQQIASEMLQKPFARVETEHFRFDYCQN